MDALRLAILGLVLSGSTAAWAADSCTLTLVNSVPLTVIKGIATVPASVGKQEKQFQIDTAAPDNQMGKDAVADFRLATEDFVPAHNDGGAGGLALNRVAATDIDGTARGITGFGSLGGMSGNGIAIYNARGVMFHSWADADTFTLGSMKSAHEKFVVTDFPEPGNGGILSAGFFRKYDIDLNFRGRRFNMFAPDHCKGQVVYWRAPGVDKLPFRFQNGKIIVRVRVDGREMDAVINTGWPRSELQFDDVDSFFYLSPKSPGVMREGAGHAYNFGVLSFGSVAIYNPHLTLTHSASATARSIDTGPQTGTLLRNSLRPSSYQPELLLGTDLLQRLHLYISFSERMVYVTQGSELPEGDDAALPVTAVTPFRP